MLKRAVPTYLPLAAGLALVFLVALWVAGEANEHLLAYSPYDSYTLQALRWRDGHIALAQNYSYLELANYDGRYWVSFPPVPTVPVWFLSFFTGDEVPSGAVVVAYFLGTLTAMYALLRRYQPANRAALWMVFIGLGGTILSLTISAKGTTGGVWYQAQLLGLLLTALAFLLVDGKSKIGWGAGLVCIALAVGCRPFNGLYVPVLLWMLLGHLKFDKKAILPYLAAPAAVALIFGIYNYVRFDNPLEFGHKYLPEWKETGESMFMLGRVPQHFADVLKLPSVEAGKLTFSSFGGFAVYLTNPMLVIGLGVVVWRAIRRKVDAVDLILVVTILIHGALLLSHRTNGGWQYGTRYLTDLLPPLVFLVARSGLGIRVPAAFVMGGLIVFNIFGMLAWQAM